MVWLFVLLAAVSASEALLRLPLVQVIRRVSATARKSARVLGSRRISDHWKERVLPRYSWIIGKGSVQFLVMLLAALLPVALLGLVFPGGPSAWSEALMRPAVIAVLCVVSIAYVWLRQRVRRG